MVGGFLALPAQNFPSVFGDNTFLIKYPYFLPCFIAGIFNLCAIGLGALFLEEVCFVSVRLALPGAVKTSGILTVFMGTFEISDIAI